MSRMPDFSHKLVQRNGKVICIMYDQNLGNLSLTNGIEKAVAYCRKEYEPAIGKKIDYFLYQDGEGMFDGWNAEKEDFILLSEPFEEGAIDALLDYHGVVS